MNRFTVSASVLAPAMLLAGCSSGLNGNEVDARIEAALADFEPGTTGTTGTSGLADHAGDPDAHHDGDHAAAISAHAAIADAHHAPVSDASQLTSGVLDMARLPLDVAVLSDLPDHGVVGNQVTNHASGANLDSTSDAELIATTPTHVYDTDVVVQAHVYLERSGATTGRYELTLRVDDCAGTVIGSTLWRPPESPTTWVADVLSLTGVATALPVGSDVVLCGRKFDVGAPTAYTYSRGIIATW